MSIFDNMINNFAIKIAQYMRDDMGKRQSIQASYYEGDHTPQLKNKFGQDDNIIANLLGVNIDRSVSRMLRGGVEFVLPKGQEYIDEVWDKNRKEILLIQWGLYGAVFGDGYIKIVPDKLEVGDKLLPRLVPLYPEIVRMKTANDDVDDIIMYRIEWHDKERPDTLYREDTIKQEDGTWMVENWIKVGGAQWRLLFELPWSYDFPPIVHNKNLPSLNSVYGSDEESDAVNIQNKFNLNVSNTGKIIKHHAHPRTIFKGVNKEQIQKLDDSPDSAIVIPNENAEAFNLEMDSELVSSREFSKDLQRHMAGVQREMDIASVEANIGDLTNFGLRVLFTDAIDKNATKRLLYGEALVEINRRLLILAGMGDDGGEVQWGDAMPVNIDEEIQADNMALTMGIVDKQTVAERSVYKARYGVDWEEIQKRKKEQIEDGQENREAAGIGSPEDNGRQGDGQSEVSVPVGAGNRRGQVSGDSRVP